MAKARAWLRKNTRGSQRSRVLVSKAAARFKPLAVDVLEQGDENAIHWFLEDKNDIRSSNYLEDAATEIQVQGLELDYTCVLWDADLRCETDGGNIITSTAKQPGAKKLAKPTAALSEEEGLVNRPHRAFERLVLLVGEQLAASELIAQYL